ncbi:MAG: GNAT family N-acetyltransferase [candidate division Zixibacteria bacterium]|nr:GNAT family N-acetyltransferase [candidate division Zixibacteria bacterium]
MTTSIDTMQGKDIPNVLGLIKAYYSEFGYSFNGKTMRRSLEELIEYPSLGCLFLIKQDETALGYMLVTFGFSLEYHGRDAFLDEIFILPAWRSRGLGRKSIEYALEFCRNSGVKAVHLEVKNDNASVFELYRSLGFVKHDGILASRRLL